MTATVGVARAAAPFLKGFDTVEPITDQLARLARAAGFAWVGRYVETLTPVERDTIFLRGLGIAPMTYADSTQPLTAALGTQLGHQCAIKLATLGAPPTVHLWADHEAPAAGSDSIGYLNARADAAIAAGYGAGQYGGEPFDLTAEQFYALKANRYWRGGGAVPEPKCGFCVLQLPPLDQALFVGLKIDVDVTCEDFYGRLPIMWWAS